MINYITNLKNSQPYNKRILVFTSLLILSIFFPIRHVFFTKEAYLTGGYSDFTSFSLYLCDILLFTTWILVILPRGRDFYHVVKPLKWLILLVFCTFIAHFGLNIRLNGYLLLKWLELIVAYGTFTLLFEQNSLKNLFFKLFAWFCGLESILALIQFTRQSSIGLFKVGESHLAPSVLGVAKIVSAGTTFIRGYGTFPHPNPFSAFLVMGVLMTVYLLTKVITTKWRILYSILLFVNILGLTVTFSRGAYLALAVGLIIFFGLYLSVIARRSAADDEAILSREKITSSARQSPNLREGYVEQAGLLAMTTIGVVLISIAISFFIFKPLLLTRTTFSDQSTVARKFYDVTGIKMSEKNPLFGVGLGESLLHMEQYSNKLLAPWDKQPPHNYFIIAAAELGLPAMLVLIWIFFSHLWLLIKKLKSNISDYTLVARNLLLVTIFCSFLALMMFDHYFYTLQQTQLLLWILLALIAAETKNSPPESSLKTIN